MLIDKEPEMPSELEAEEAKHLNLQRPKYLSCPTAIAESQLRTS